MEDTTNVGSSAVSWNNGAAGNATGGGANGMNGDGKFDVTGLSLVGDGIKAVEIENVLDNGNASATLIGWIEDT